MGYGSAVPEARDQIITALQARPALSAVTISKHPPASPTDLKSGSAHEAIYVGRVDGQSYQGRMEIASMTAGASAFDDQFTFWLTIQVAGTTTAATEETCSERAQTLFAEIVGLAATYGGRTGVSTSSTLLKFWVDGIEYDEQTYRLDRAGAVANLAVGLRCNARKLLS